MYFEKQRGGLCRMHALNMFYQEEKYTDETFKNLQEEYDLKHKQFNDSSCVDYDAMISTQESILVYSLKQNGYFCETIECTASTSIDTIQSLMDDELRAIFIMTKDHVHLIKYMNDKFYEFNSLKRQPIIIRSLHSTLTNLCRSRCYMTIVWSKTYAMKQLLELPAQINEIITSNQLNGIVGYVVNELYEKRLIGTIERLLSKFYELHFFVHGMSEVYLLFMEYLRVFNKDPANTNELICRLPVLIKFMKQYTATYILPNEPLIELQIVSTNGKCQLLIKRK